MLSELPVSPSRNPSILFPFYSYEHESQSSI